MTLSRGRPLERGQGLSRGAGLSRGTGLARTSSMPRSAPAPARPSRARRAQAAEWTGLRLVALERDEHRCARCADAGPLEVHHRRRKGMGGSRMLDHLANLVSLCGWGNHTGCHGWAHSWPAEAEWDGLTLPDGVDIAETPVRYHDGLWLLDDEGDRRRAA